VVSAKALLASLKVSSPCEGAVLNLGHNRQAVGAPTVALLRGSPEDATLAAPTCSVIGLRREHQLMISRELAF